MAKQQVKDWMREMSVEDRMQYKADIEKMKRDIKKAIEEHKKEALLKEVEDKWCNYSGMPSPKAYEQKATQSNNYGWVDNEDDDDDYPSNDGEDNVGWASDDDSNEY